MQVPSHILAIVVVLLGFLAGLLLGAAVDTMRRRDWLRFAGCVLLLALFFGLVWEYGRL
jgi:hypothetical protein